MKVIARRQHYRDHLTPICAALAHAHADIDDDVTLVASYPDVIAAKRAGAAHVVLAQHGMGQSYGTRHPHYAGGDHNEAVDLFLVPNAHSAERWRRAYPSAAIAVVGCPRVDQLPARQPGPLTIALAWHWDLHMVPETLSAFSWYRAALPQLAAAYTVIGTGHPRRGDLQAQYAGMGIEYVPSFDDVCRRADLLLFDNTSAGYEFAATGRPVVVLDAPWYRRQVQHGLRFWESADVGVRIDDPADLIPAVARALAQVPADTRAREAALARVYAYRHGAARRAAAAIVDRYAA